MRLSACPSARASTLALLLLAAGCDRDPRPSQAAEPATATTAPTAAGAEAPAAMPDPAPASAPATPPSATVADDARSVYTSLAAKDCTTVRTDTEGSYTEQRCQGFADIPVLVKEGDLRMDVDAGVAGDFKTLGPFNRVGDRLEWRLDGAGKPIAIIYRLTSEDGTRTLGSHLVVERIGTKAKPACWTALVKGSTPDANRVARDKADAAPRAACLVNAEFF